MESNMFAIWEVSRKISALLEVMKLLKPNEQLHLLRQEQIHQYELSKMDTITNPIYYRVLLLILEQVIVAAEKDAGL